MTDLTLYHPAAAPAMPMSFAEMERMANIMASAKLVPPHFRKSPGDCMLVIRLAEAWEMDPFLLMQECYSINEKLMLSGKLAAARINTKARLVGRLAYEYSGEGDSRAITVIGQFANETEPREVKVELKNAKTGNDQWKKQPDQQLMYAGARTWGRRHTPELLLGVTFEGELVEAARLAPRISDIKIQSPPSAPAPAPEPQQRDIIDDLIDPQTGEVLDQHVDPFEIEMTEGSSWGQFIEPLQRYMTQSLSIAEYDKWRLLNQDLLLKLREAKPQLFRLFEKNLEPTLQRLTAGSRSS